jgi:hypothetical protein
MQLSAHELCQTFRERAAWTDRVIEQGLSTRLGILEETITDMHLLEIASRHDQYVIIKKFSRKQEGCDSGADWLWCFGEPGAWFSILVQAKVINPLTGACYHLNYNGGKQRRLLVDFARKYKLFPVYCIYSHLINQVHPLTRSIPVLSNFSPMDWACSYIIPKHIRWLIHTKHNTQADLFRYSIPWTYPLCFASSQNQSNLAKGIAEALFKMREELGESQRESVRIQWENPNPMELIASELPKIVRDLLSSKVKAKDSPVSGISVISTVPIRLLEQEYNALPEGTGYSQIIKGEQSRVQRD